MNKLKEVAKKIIYGKHASSNAYISYLRGLGIQIGDDVTIYSPTKTLIDEQYPWTIKIGNHVRIAEGVKIITHDYSWSVMKTCSGVIAGASGTIDIGNNVFIGMNSIILRNVTVGDNVIIGTGSVVTKDCEPNSVYAGVPAKRIMSLDDYAKKRTQAQAKEAKSLALKYSRFTEISRIKKFFMNTLCCLNRPKISETILHLTLRWIYAETSRIHIST